MPLKDNFANLYDPHNICLDEYNEDEDKTNSLFHKDHPPPPPPHPPFFFGGNFFFIFFFFLIKKYYFFFFFL